MIRAWIGWFLLGCLEAHGRRVNRAIVQQLDLAKMSDAQVSDVIHGRKLPPGTPGVTTLEGGGWLTRLPHRGRVS